MTYLLGVDAGNTKTVALVADASGRIVGAGRGGCGEIHNKGVEYALCSLDSAVGTALSTAGIHSDQLQAGGFSMAGADWPEDFDLLRAAVSERGYGRVRVVVNDAIGALRVGSATGDAVSVVCGTGTAVGARSAAGRLWHVGFWYRHHTGARGLGQYALDAVFQSELGMFPPTVLTTLVLEQFEQPSVEALLRHLTQPHRALDSEATQVCRLLLDAAQQDDSVALHIVHEAGATMGRYALAAARQVGISAQAFTLVLTGGVFRHQSPILEHVIIETVRRAAPDITPVRNRWEPVVGGLLLAFDAANIRVGEEISRNVDATLLDQALFVT